jgi:hypothetical protein
VNNPRESEVEQQLENGERPMFCGASRTTIDRERSGCKFKYAMLKVILTLVSLFAFAPGAEAGDEIPGTPGFTAEVQWWGVKNDIRVIALIVPQESLPLGTSKLCISGAYAGRMLCSDQSGPHGLQWDAPLAFYFMPEAAKNFPRFGSILMLSGEGKSLATFAADLQPIERLPRAKRQE